MQASDAENISHKQLVLVPLNSVTFGQSVISSHIHDLWADCNWLCQFFHSQSRRKGETADSSIQRRCHHLSRILQGLSKLKFLGLALPCP